MTVVVAAIGPLRNRQAAELTRPDHDCLVQKPALFEIANQGSAGLVAAGAERFERLGILVVRIPRLTAQKELNEPHASLDQATGGQTAAGVFPRGRVVQAVHSPGLLRLPREIKRLGHGCLHGGGDLEVGDPCVELRVARMTLPVRLIELIQKPKLALASLGRDALPAS